MRCPLTPQEFEHIQEAYWKIPNRELGLCGSALNSFQLHMVGRLDGSAKFREADLKAYTMFPEFGVWARLPWSKNVVEERDAPPQVLLASMDTRYDCISNLGLWLEYHYKLNPGENEFIFAYSGLDEPIEIQERLCR